MSQNINQIFVTSPATSMQSTDLLYLGRSPYNINDDFAITFANFVNSIAPAISWNATTNTPTLTNSTTGPQGVLYLVKVAGTTHLNSVTTWAVGDYAYFTGGAWTKLTAVFSDNNVLLENKLLEDTSTAFVGSVDQTKQLSFNLSGGVANSAITFISTVLDSTDITIPDGGDDGGYTLVGTALPQTILNKLLGDSEIDGTTLTTACTFIGNADATKVWALSLNGKTSGTTSTSVYTGGAQTITYPTGDFTVAKANESQIGNITPYVVGLSTSVAPYTSIDTALIAANAVFVSSGFKQMVYIQPGEYTQNFTPLAGVDIIGLGYSTTIHTAANIATCAVRILGQMILTNTVNINIVGIEMDAPSTVTITSSGSNSPNVNFVFCILKKSSGTGTSMFFSTNTNIIATFCNCLLYGGTSKRIFDVDAGSYYLEDCTQQASSNAEATFDGTHITYNNCVISDSIRIQNSAILIMNYSNLLTGGNFAAIILDHAASHAEVNYSTLNAGPGFTNYVIEGAVGATVKINNMTCPSLSAIEADIIATSYAMAATTVILTSASNHIATDASKGTLFTHTLTENTTLDNPTNMVAGTVYTWEFIQAASAKTLAFGSNFTWPGGTALVVSTGSAAIDIISGLWDGTKLRTVIVGQAFA